MTYYSSYYPEIQAARIQIQGRIRSLQERLYLRREVTNEMQKQQLEFSIQNLYTLLRQTIDQQTYLHNQIRNLKQQVIIDKKYQKKVNNIQEVRKQANQRALLLENRYRNYPPINPRTISYSDPLINYPLVQTNQRAQLKQKLQRQYQQNLHRSRRDKEYLNSIKQNNKLRYQDLQEQKLSNQNSNSKYAKSNAQSNKKDIKQVTLNPYQKPIQREYEASFNHVNGGVNQVNYENFNKQKIVEQKQRLLNDNQQDLMKQDELIQKLKKKHSKNQSSNQQTLDKYRQSLNKLNTSRIRDELAKAKNQELSKSRLQHARNQHIESNKNVSQTPQNNNFYHSNNSMVERSLQKYQRYQPLNDSGTKGILKKSAHKQRLKHDPDTQKRIKQSATKKIQNRMMQSWALYQDSQFKNTKHQKQHLFNTYNKQYKFRRQIKQKIEFQPIIQKKYGLHIQEK